MLQLDIAQALSFLDKLDKNGRHTIASEAPFGGRDDGPKWEGGATYENYQRELLIKDIKDRQKRGSNVYYSVNRPCRVDFRVGVNGKNNIDDIVAIRCLAFDIDFTTKKDDELISSLLNWVDKNLDGELRPSMVINTGGGFQLIYFLREKQSIKLFRPANTDEEKRINNDLIYNRSSITNLAHDFETMLRAMVPKDLPIKIDNMSNVDRVMRLPGTINYPKLEKQAKGQTQALAHIAVEYNHKIDIQILRDIVPETQVVPKRLNNGKPYKPPKNDKWTAYKKALACCEFLKENGLADSNEIYTLNVMLPLIGAIHAEEDYNRLDEAQAEELFLLAISGGERFGVQGRGIGYFKRQWKSHRPNIERKGTKGLGGLIWFCQQNNMELPWKFQVIFQEDFERQEKELSELQQTIDEETMRLLTQP